MHEVKKEIVENYAEIIEALRSCPLEENCRNCDDFTECIHWIRSILVIILKFIKKLIKGDISISGFEKVAEFPKDLKVDYIS